MPSTYLLCGRLFGRSSAVTHSSVLYTWPEELAGALWRVHSTAWYKQHDTEELVEHSAFTFEHGLLKSSSGCACTENASLPVSTAHPTSPAQSPAVLASVPDFSVSELKTN
jgi:hypothetical protein